MNSEAIIKRVKDYVEHRLQLSKGYYSTKSDVLAYRQQAFGAVDFATSLLYPPYNIELINWWHDEAYDRFTDLM